MSDVLLNGKVDAMAFSEVVQAVHLRPCRYLFSRINFCCTLPHQVCSSVAVPAQDMLADVWRQSRHVRTFIPAALLP